jgi:hypothetical protein
MSSASHIGTKHSLVRDIAMALACVSVLASTAPAQNAPTQEPAAAANAPAAPIPRLPDGHPNLQGTWFKAVAEYGPLGVPTAAAAGKPRATGFAPPDPNSDEFYKQGARIPYRPEATKEKKWRMANEYLDGEPRCHLSGVPRSAEQPPYPHMIIQDDKTVTILYEYVHEARIIPIDNSPHPKHYWGWDGDSRGHWDGDTLVIDVSNFNGRSWLDMSGNFVDENLHVVERYTMLDADTYAYEATITDPTVFLQPWTIKFNVKRQPAADQIFEYSCLEGEGDRYHYTEDAGGLRPVAGAPTAAAASVPPGEVIHGCLRGRLAAGKVVYHLEVPHTATLSVEPSDAVSGKLPELIDRDVRLQGHWLENPHRFDVRSARALEEGCAAGP